MITCKAMCSSASTGLSDIRKLSGVYFWSRSFVETDHARVVYFFHHHCCLQVLDGARYLCYTRSRSAEVFGDECCHTTHSAQSSTTCKGREGTHVECTLACLFRPGCSHARCGGGGLAKPLEEMVLDITRILALAFRARGGTGTTI